MHARSCLSAPDASSSQSSPGVANLNHCQPIIATRLISILVHRYQSASRIQACVRGYLVRQHTGSTVLAAIAAVRTARAALILQTVGGRRWSSVSSLLLYYPYCSLLSMLLWTVQPPELCQCCCLQFFSCLWGTQQEWRSNACSTAGFEGAWLAEH